MKTKFTTAIIAGGRSNRFGDSKLQALFNGKRLIDRAVDCALQVSPQVVIVGGRAPLPENLSAPVVYDVTPEIGPLGGILTALLFCKTAWLAVMPCDAPLLSPQVYDELFRHAQAAPVVAVSHDGIEPLVSLWPRLALPILKASVTAGDYALRPALRRLDALMCDMTTMDGYNGDWFVNINSRHDLYRLRAAAVVEH